LFHQFKTYSYVIQEFIWSEATESERRNSFNGGKGYGKQGRKINRNDISLSSHCAG
jgi:hypothetical protein